MSRSWGFFFVVWMAAVTYSTAAYAADDSQSMRDREQFVIGNIVFVLLHEFGHLVIDDFDIPVLGNSEDAADTLAAISLIRLDRARPESDYAYIRMLLSAADANRILWNSGIERDNPDTYGARHPLSVQRVARIACLVYGSDTDTFAPLGEVSYLPEFRADWCDSEFEDAEKAWEWVRDTFIKTADRGETKHDVRYGKAKDPRHEEIRARLLDARGLERAMEIVEATVLLPDSITLRTSSCGSPNAYWDPNSRDVVLCYELAWWFYELSSQQKITELERQMREFHRND